MVTLQNGGHSSLLLCVCVGATAQHSRRSVVEKGKIKREKGACNYQHLRIVGIFCSEKGHLTFNFETVNFGEDSAIIKNEINIKKCIGSSFIAHISAMVFHFFNVTE